MLSRSRQESSHHLVTISCHWFRFLLNNLIILFLGLFSSLLDRFFLLFSLFLNFIIGNLRLRHKWFMILVFNWFNLFTFLGLLLLSWFFTLTRLDCYNRLIIFLDNPNLSQIVIKVIKQSLILHQLYLQVMVRLIMVRYQVVYSFDQRA